MCDVWGRQTYAQSPYRLTFLGKPKTALKNGQLLNAQNEKKIKMGNYVKQTND